MNVVDNLHDKLSFMSLLEMADKIPQIDMLENLFVTTRIIKLSNRFAKSYLPGTKEGLHETYLIFEDSGSE